MTYSRYKVSESLLLQNRASCRRGSNQLFLTFAERYLVVRAGERTRST